MSLIGSVKRFFGFEKPNISAPPMSSVSAFEAQLSKVPPEAQTAFISEAFSRVEAESADLQKNALGQAGKASTFFTGARDHFAFEIYVYRKMHAPETPEVDSELELRLGRILRYAESFAQPSNEVAAALTQYIQACEEHILLAEMRGEYGLALSENGKWIRFPFLKEGLIKPVHKREAVQTLSTLYMDCPELSLLELETRVPWHPISSFDFMEKAKSGRMSLLRVPDGEKYYGYLYT